MVNSVQADAPYDAPRKPQSVGQYVSTAWQCNTIPD